MTIEVNYYAIDHGHIMLRPDGSIEVTILNSAGTTTFIIDYRQARILGEMIIAKHELEKVVRG